MPNEAAQPAPRPLHRPLLLLFALLPLCFCIFGTAQRFWLLRAGESLTAVVTTAKPHCSHGFRGDCFLGRAYLSPRNLPEKWQDEPFNQKSRGRLYLVGGRFYEEGEELPMRMVLTRPDGFFGRIFRFRSWTVIDRRDWLFGPVRWGAASALLFIAAAMPVKRWVLWLAPALIAFSLMFGR